MLIQVAFTVQALERASIRMTSTTFAFKTLLSVLGILGLLSSFARAQTSNQADRESSILPYVLFPRIFDFITTYSLETPIQIRAFFYLQLAVYNAWSSYHPTAADIFGRTRLKRPKEEHTSKNKNIAGLYAVYRLYENSPESFGGPSKLGEFRIIFYERGLDPDDASQDLSTPVGIGNKQGMDLSRLIKIDGWNSEGNLQKNRITKTLYRLPFFDQTGYTPVNTPWRLNFPLRWQPLLETNQKGFFFRQEHVTPQAGSAIAFAHTPLQISQKKTSEPYMNLNATRGSVRRRDMNSLKTEFQLVFRRSMQLTEEERLYAELFDNKVKAFRSANYGQGVLGLAAAFRFAILPFALDWTYDEELIFGLGSNIASYDSTIIAWREKIRIDAVRPTAQTAEYAFGKSRRFLVWGGPKQEAKKSEISAAEWQPYLRTMPHSEFPSGSACLCQAFVDHVFENTNYQDKFSYTFTIPKGSSSIHPGLVPTKNVSLSINKISEWNRLCGLSRLWGGVHFGPAVVAAKDLRKGIGKQAQTVVNALIAGQSRGILETWLGKKVMQQFS